MLALQAYEDACCSNCGGYLPDVADEKAEESYRVEAVRCHRCTSISQTAEGHRESSHPQALLYHVERR